MPVVIAYFLIYVVWGSTYFFIGQCLHDIPPFMLGALRFSMAGAVLLAICGWRGEKLLKKKLILKSAVSGIVLLFIDQAVIMFAQQYVSSSLVAIVASSTALWIMLLDVRAWRQNFRRPATVLGMVLGFAGVGMLYAEQLYSDTSVHPDSEVGILLLVGGCISWACGTLYSKYRSSAEEETNGFAGSAWQMLSASVVFSICTTISDDFSTADMATISMTSWLSLAYLITFGSLLAYSAYVWLLKVRPASEVATHAYVNPVVAVALGAGIGGEHVTAVQIAGLAVILASVMMVSMRKR